MKFIERLKKSGVDKAEICLIGWNVKEGDKTTNPEVVDTYELIHAEAVEDGLDTWQCSIFGRACDVECYVHLEEKGVLTKKFKAPYRKRTPWSFSVEDFK